ncbi:MAG: response regulator transcription factor [Spirochaetales bacterium]|nr:response regulator transcription factor [Spirochaetales bacterium]
MKILLIEDDIKTAQFIVKGLKQAQYNVRHSQDGLDGLALINNESFDLVILDIMLPGMDGFKIIDKTREKNISVPIIVLSAKSALDDRIMGLHKGCDDYLVKPFSFSELLARIQAVTRRAKASQEPMTLSVADLVIDLLKHRVWRGDKLIDIQPLEFMLLEYLMRHSGQVVSKVMIMENVWDYNFDPQTNVVEARICKLREKIDKPYKNKLLHTVRGFGYVLEEKK